MSFVPRDPMQFFRILWPSVKFFDRQEEIIRSVQFNTETFVVAAHQMGKDFTAAAIILWAFLCHREARVVATSIRGDHLRVLFGEVGRFIKTAQYPLTADQGGPLLCNHLDIKKVVEGKVCPISYLRGMVSEKGEGLAGHHAEYTLFVADEASGIPDVSYERATTWAKRILVFGNAYPPGPGCRFFRDAVKRGDILAGEAVTV